MFCVLWTATLATALLPANGMFIAALVLWGFFGSLFTLAERIDAGRSVGSFIKQLDTALDTRNSLSGAADRTSSPGQAFGEQLFRTRFQAGLFLAGLTAFWGGFLLVALLVIATGPSAGHPRQVNPFEVVATALTFGGGIALVISERSLSVRLASRRVPGFWTTMRMIMPATLAEAARMLGLNGRLVAGALYLVLLAGIAAFLTSFLGR